MQLQKCEALLASMQDGPGWDKMPGLGVRSHNSASCSRSCGLLASRAMSTRDRQAPCSCSKWNPSKAVIRRNLEPAVSRACVTIRALTLNATTCSANEWKARAAAVSHAFNQSLSFKYSETSWNLEGSLCSSRGCNRCLPPVSEGAAPRPVAVAEQ